MKALLSLICAAFLLFPACEKVDLPTDKPDNTEKEPQPTPLDTDTLTVAEAQELYAPDDELIVWVKGYIVGTVNGTSISKALFTAQTGVVANLLLADTPLETDYTRCIPVELKAGSAMREGLNLAGHPELYQTRVAVYGVLCTYFKMAGIKKSFDYRLTGEDPLPPLEETDKRQTAPAIRQTPQQIKGGR